MAGAAQAHPATVSARNNEKEQELKLQWLCEAFPALSVQQISSAYQKCNRDANKAIDEISGSFDVNKAVNGVSDACDASSSRSSSSAPKGTYESAQASSKGKGKPKYKKFSVSAGSVSSFIGNGNGHARSSQNHKSRKENGFSYGENTNVTAVPFNERSSSEQRAQNFLHSMIGDGLHLDKAVIDDVLGECGYDVQESLTRLLDIATNSKLCEGQNSGIIREGDSKGENDSYNQVMDGHLENALSILDDNERPPQANSKNINCPPSNTTEVHAMERLKQEFPSLSATALYNTLEPVNFSYSDVSHNLYALRDESRCPKSDKSTLSMQVLESLFARNEEREKPNKNTELISGIRIRRKKHKNSLLNLSASEPTDIETTETRHDIEDDEYTHFRKISAENWVTMKSYYKEAANAYARGDPSRAAYLSEQGSYYKQIACEAEEKASLQILKSKELDTKDITLDLHIQDAKKSIDLLKFQIQALICTSSSGFLRVFVGEGRRREKIKQAVTQFLDKEGIVWNGEGGGMLVIKMEDINPEGLSFLGSDSD